MNSFKPLWWHRHAELRPKPKDASGRTLRGMQRIEEKLDGWRVTLYAGEGRCYAVGRKWWQDLAPQLSHDLAWKHLIKNMPQDSIIDGELTVNGGRASDVPSMLAHDPSRLVLHAFAAPIIHGEWNTGIREFQQSDAFIQEHARHHPDRLTLVRTLSPVRTSMYDIPPENQLILQAEATNRGLEGYIVKGQLYSNWWKIKPVHTVDCFVTGIVQGKGKHAGRNGALLVSLYDQHFRVHEIASIGKGGDEHWRDTPLLDMLGRVVEVAHEGVQSQGRLKFSRFLRWRDDKPAKECTVLQLAQAKERLA